MLVVSTALALLLVLPAVAKLRASSSEPTSVRRPEFVQETPLSTKNLTDEQSLAIEAEHYARDFGVSEAEAARRLALQQQIGKIAEQLREADPARFAGFWVINGPEFSAVASYTGQSALPAAQVIATGAPLPVDIRLGAEHSLAELIVAEGRARDELGSTVGALSIEEERNSLKIEITPASVWFQTPDDLRAREEAALDVAVVVETAPASLVAQSTYGGKRLTTGGIFSQYHCTTGFTVANAAGATGVTTAGHCSNTLTYWETSSASFGTTFVAQAMGLYHDVQWSSVAGTEYNDVWNGSGLQQITSVTPRINLYTNEYICHYGEGSYVQIGQGYTCGYTLNLYYDPGSICGTSQNQPCGATWVEMSGLSLDCFGGDSGGPWFSLSSAFGSHTFGPPNGGSPCVFMPLDYLDTLGVYVLTS